MSSINSVSKCALCEFFSDERPRRYYVACAEFVIIESPTTYTPLLVSAHGVLKPGVTWFQALKSVAGKLYGEDFCLQPRRSGDHFLIETAAITRTRDLLFRPQP